MGKITCDRAELADALAIVKKFVGGSGSTRVLTGMHITADGSDLIIEATNNVTAVRKRVYLDGPIDADFTVMPSLADAVNAMKGDVITLDIDTEIAVSGTGKTIIRIPIIPGAYPKLNFESANTAEVDPEDVSWMSVMREVASFAASDFGRGAIAGVRVTTHGDGQSVLTATDGHKLLCKTVDVQPFVEETIIMRNIIKDVPMIFGDTAKMYVDNVFAAASDDLRTEYSCRMINGQYPDMDRIIPKENLDQIITFDKGLLQEALKRMSVVTDKTASVHLTSGTDSNETELSIAGAHGSAVDTVLSSCEGSEPLETTLNVNNLILALGSIPGDVVNLQFDTKRAVRVTGGGNDKSDSLALVLPVNRRR